MNKILSILILLLISCIAWAQTERRTIVDDLNSTKSGQGSVKIYQEEKLKSIVGTPGPDSLTDDVTTTNTIKAKGYKITLFSGNQAKSKQEAESKMAQFKSVYPDVDAVISYKSPQWRLRVGNYRTREEAMEAMSEFKKNLPVSLAREMRIAEDVIKRSAE